MAWLKPPGILVVDDTEADRYTVSPAPAGRAGYVVLRSV